MMKMECKIFCFVKKKIDVDFLIDELNANYRNYRIIANDFQIIDRLEKENFNVKSFGSYFPENKNITKQIYQKAKKYQEEYREVFKNIRIDTVEIFKGIEYNLLLQLILISKVNVLLEKNIDTILIFNRFSPAYYAMIKNANDLGYLTNNEINLLEKNKIKKLNVDTQIEEKSLEKISKNMTMNFISSYFTKSFSLNNFKEQTKLILKIGIFLIQKKMNSKIYKSDSESIKKFLSKLDNKLKPPIFSSQSKIALFISATRLDLYLQPIIPVLKKFDSKNEPFQIIAGDLATGMALSKEGFSCLNIFEEINILIDILKKDQKNQFFNEINKICKNELLFGFNELKHDLINKIYRTISIVIILQHVIQKMKLKSIIVSPTGQIFDNISLEIVKKLNINSFSFVPSPSDPYPVFADWFHAKKLFVDGKQGMELLNELNYDPKKTIITGSTKFDHLKTLDSINSKKILEKEHKIDSSKKLITLVLSRWRKNDELWITKIINFCNNNNFEIIIKIHPYYKLNQIDTNEKYIKILQENCKNKKFLISIDIDIPILLSASDLVITEQSTLGLDAIVLEKNLIMVKFSDFNMDKAVKFYEFGAAIQIMNYSVLEDTILEIFEGKKYVKELEKGREKVIEQYNFRNDGNASERIYQFLMEELQ
jgi:hypothetical protein